MDPIAHFDGKGILIVAQAHAITIEAGRSLVHYGAFVMGPLDDSELVVRLIKGGSVDAAILDVELGVKEAILIVEELEREHVPFVFALAELRAQIPADFAGYRLVAVVDELRVIALALFQRSRLG
jgi:hypothetical protein